MQIFRATWIAHCTTVLWFSSSTVLVHIPIILLLAMVLVKKRKERKSSVGFLFSFALPHTDGDVRASRWDFSLIFALCSRGGFLLPASPSLTLWYFADALDCFRISRCEFISCNTSKVVENACYWLQLTVLADDLCQGGRLFWLNNFCRGFQDVACGAILFFHWHGYNNWLNANFVSNVH